jgi:hypothetical protein
MGTHCAAYSQDEIHKVRGQGGSDMRSEQDHKGQSGRIGSFSSFYSEENGLKNPLQNGLLFDSHRYAEIDLGNFYDHNLRTIRFDSLEIRSKTKIPWL